MGFFQQNPFEQPMMLGSGYESFDGGAGSLTASSRLTTIPALSRRGSACSNASSSSEMNSYGGGSTETLTPEHHMLLERQFSETRKPAVKVRRSLAEQAGLSVQVVSAWFQSRRAKTELQEKQEEIHTKRILEAAGRRRVATTPPTLPPQSQPPNLSVTVTPSGSNMSDHSYSSPAEASYASLARSLAIAAAASQPSESEQSFQEPHPEFSRSRQNSFVYSAELDGRQSPFPVSAFSDYGSSQCSSAAYTPASGSQLDDPFEYDNFSRRPSLTFDSQPQSRKDSYFQSDIPSPDNFELFAQAIEMNNLMNYNFVLPSFPPKRLVERRPEGFAKDGEKHDDKPHQGEPVFYDPFAASFGQAVMQNRSLASQVEPEPVDTVEDNTLAARRRRPDPKPLDVRSQTFAGGTQENNNQSQPIQTLRRINTVGANLGNHSKISKSPRSPFRFDKYVEASILEEKHPDTASVIRPHTASSITHPISGLFSGPLTPVSPPNPEKSPAERHSVDTGVQQYVAEAADKTISPPATPQMHACVSEMAKSEAEKEHLSRLTMSESFLTAIPRHVEQGTSPYALFSESSQESEDGDMFAFDCYLSAPMTSTA